MNGKNGTEKRKEKDEQERSYRWLVFFCCYEFGGCFLEGGGVEMSWWGMERLLQVSFFLFLLLLHDISCR